MTTFNFHPHLPHYALTTEDTKVIRVLARQPVDMSIPTRSRRRETVSLIHSFGCRRAGRRAGDILLADLTIFTTLFGGTDSLDRFWNNLGVRT